MEVSSEFIETFREYRNISRTILVLILVEDS